MCETSLGRSQTWWPSMVLEFPKLDRLWTYKMTIYSPFWWHQWCDFPSLQFWLFWTQKFWPRSTPTTARPSFDHWHSPTLMPAAHRTQYLEGGDNAKTRNWNIFGGSGLKLHRKKSWAPETSPCVTCKYKNAREGWLPIKGVLHFNKHLQRKNMSTKTPDPSYHGC